jgi:hypothetical protein
LKRIGDRRRTGEKVEQRTVSNERRRAANGEAGTNGLEWFAAYLPKRAASPESEPAAVAAVAAAAVPPAAELPPPAFIDEVRAEIDAVTRNLADPSAAGVRASIPHLERAIAALGNHVKSPEASEAIQPPAIASLRAELAIATRLFENAYELHAVWATQLGIHLDGTPRQLLYGRPGQLEPGVSGASLRGSMTLSDPDAKNRPNRAGESWEG